MAGQGFMSMFGGNRQQQQINNSSNGNNGNNNQNNGNNNGNGDSNNNNGNNGNNNANSGFLTENIWDTTTTSNGNSNNGNQNGNNNNQNNNNNNNSNNNNVPPPNGFDDYVKTLKFAPGLTPENLTKLQNGDFSELPGLMENASRDAYKQAMFDMNTLMQKRINEAVDTAVSKANASRTADNFVDKMFTALPFTRDDNIQPVAKSVMSQFIKKGKSIDDAIEGTRNFFKHVHGISAKDLGVNSSGGRPGSRSFMEQNAGDEPDWMEFLSASGN